MAKTIIHIIGTILFLIGALGFISNSLIGTDALFASDAAHNAVHLVLGALLFAAAWWSKDTLFWLTVVGTILLLLGVIGLVTVPKLGGELLGILYTNGPYNWFHIIAGVVIVTAGLHGRRT